MPDLRIIGVLAAVLVVALAGWLGYDYGSASVRADWEAERADVSRKAADALAALAARVQDAESRYEAERARKQRVVTRTLTEVRHDAQRLPARNCPLQPAARGLLLRAHCAAFGDSADPACLPGAVPASADPAARGQ